MSGSFCHRPREIYENFDLFEGEMSASAVFTDLLYTYVHNKERIAHFVNLVLTVYLISPIKPPPMICFEFFLKFYLRLLRDLKNANK